MEPPGPETRVVCVRCKLFYKKESEFKEKGVGTLHLKLTEQGKTQLIVRADTNLGKAAFHSAHPAGSHHQLQVVCGATASPAGGTRELHLKTDRITHDQFSQMAGGRAGGGGVRG